MVDVHLGIGDSSRIRSPFESCFSQYIRTTFCSSLAATSALNWLWIKIPGYKRLLTTINRTPAATHVAHSLSLSFSLSACVFLSFSPTGSLCAHGYTIASSTTDRKRERNDPLFSVSNDSSERFRAGSGTYIGARSPHRVSINLTASLLPWTSITQHRSHPDSRETGHEKYKRSPGNSFYGNSCVSSVEINRAIEKKWEFSSRLSIVFRARFIYLLFLCLRWEGFLTECVSWVTHFAF